MSGSPPTFRPGRGQDMRMYEPPDSPGEKQPAPPALYPTGQSEAARVRSASDSRVHVASCPLLGASATSTSRQPADADTVSTPRPIRPKTPVSEYPDSRGTTFRGSVYCIGGTKPLPYLRPATRRLDCRPAGSNGQLHNPAAKRRCHTDTTSNRNPISGTESLLFTYSKEEPA